MRGALSRHFASMRFSQRSRGSITWESAESNLFVYCWSAIKPPLFTLMQFALDVEKQRNARVSLLFGLRAAASAFRHAPRRSFLLWILAAQLLEQGLGVFQIGG